MAYGSIDGVSALIPTVGGFDATSTPTEVQVRDWLDQGYARINRALSGAGYAFPVATSSGVYAELSGLNNMFAQIRVLRARGLDTIQGKEQDKASTLSSEFDDQLESLVSADLTNMGVSIATAQKGNRRRRVGSLQLRRVDGYSGQYADSYEEYENVSD